jgi:hypothetical protein
MVVSRRGILDFRVSILDCRTENRKQKAATAQENPREGLPGVLAPQIREVESRIRNRVLGG